MRDILKVHRALFEQLFFSFVRYVKNSSKRHDLNDFISKHGYLIGSRLGLGFVNRFEQAAGEKSHLTLEKIRFIGKEVWQDLFGKTIDALQTDHGGVFILLDHDFQLFQTVSSESSSEENFFLGLYLSFISSLIHGVASSLLTCQKVRYEVKAFDPSLTLKQKVHRRSNLLNEGRRAVHFRVEVAEV